MRVDDNFSASSELLTPSVDRAHGPDSARTSRQERQDPADSASISSLASGLAQQIQNDPPNVVNRIGELREAVRAGTYEEPAIEVARSVIDDALSFQTPAPPPAQPVTPAQPATPAAGGAELRGATP